MDKNYQYILQKVQEGEIKKEVAIRMLTMLRQAGIQTDEKGKEDIAIIGIASHIAGTNSHEEFWDNIEAGVDLTGALPEERVSGIDSYLSQRFKKINSKVSYQLGGYLKEIKSFDYNFFKISPKEAKLMDPSQRLFLQTAWEAIEDAGYGGRKLNGSNMGVYVGYAANSNYHNMILDTDPQSAGSALVGNISAMLPTRIAYMLNLKGPTMLVDTACSSSAVAIHLACQAIKNGDCESAIAGGIRLNLLPVDFEGLKLGVEAADGKTRTFDKEAQGASFGEGSAAIILKSLKRAEEDGDSIYAVIKGSAINQDGNSIGITAPNSTAQSEVLLKAWKDAGINPETLAFIEAHGTATKLGDPLEIEGLGKAFEKYTNKKQFCAIGTLKTNVGHLYECAGIAGVIKSVMALKNRKIPGTSNFNVPNKTIDFQQSPVYVNTDTQEWHKRNYPRRCGVSAFGLSGTNCHIVLEEYIQEVDTNEENPNLPNLIVLSAQSSESLKAILTDYKLYLNKDKFINKRDLCYTVSTGRGHYSHRIAIVFNDITDLMAKITYLSEQELLQISHEDIRYGVHKVVHANKDELDENEIKESERMGLTREASESLIEFCEGGKKNVYLLNEICEKYINGAHVEWETMYEGETRKKVQAPVYVFDKSPCWIEIPERSKDLSPEDTMLYTMEWRKDNAQPLPLNDTKGKVLFFANSPSMRKKIIDSFRARDIPVVVVELMEEIEDSQVVNKYHYRINGSQKSYVWLMNELKDSSISRIIHSYATECSAEPITLEGLNNVQMKGAYSLFYLIKAFAKLDIQQDITLSILTKYAFDVVGNENQIIPSNAALHGIGKVIMKEMPKINCQLIDIDDTTSLNLVMDEIQSVKEGTAIALRNGERYKEVFTEIMDDKIEPELVKVRDKGVYIVTGGLGGIGLETSKYLVSKKPVKLVLINRSALPSRSKWEGLLRDNGTPDKQRRRINGLLELERLGASVEYYSADVSDYGQMSEIVEGIKRKHGKINGIIHCAGTSNDGPIATRSKQMFQTIYSPKVNGTWVLDSLTKNEKLDFFVLSSSVATMFGAFGQGDYAAANTYLDAFASYRNRRGEKTIAINWTTWKETGMAYESGHVMDGIFNMLPTSDGISGFERLLNSNIHQALVGKINYSGVGSMLLVNSNVECSEGINNQINESRKQQTMTGKNSKMEVYKEKGVIIKGRSNGKYSEQERDLALCCKEVLGINEIDIHEHLLEMGADSLVLMKLQGEIESRLFVTVTVDEMFENPTVFELANLINKNSNNQTIMDTVKFPALQTAPIKDVYPVAYAQQRMFLAHRRDPNSTNLNQFRVSILDMSIDPEQMESAIRKIIQRHEILRTTIKLMDGEIVQRVQEHVDFNMEYQEVEEEEEVEVIIKKFKRPFNLEAPPLFRIGLIKVREDKFYLIYDVHHIITDGVSMELFMQELIQSYQGGNLPIPTYQYKDYAVWQKECMDKEFMITQGEYWKSLYGNKVPTLVIPTDYARTDQLKFEGSNVTRILNTSQTKMIRKTANQTQTTMYILILSAYSVLLGKYSAQEDLVIGSPTIGRPRKEFNKILGIFINMIAMRVKPSKEKMFIDYLEQVKLTAATAFDNQDFPYDELIQQLNLDRNQNRHPLFETLFIYQNIPVEERKNTTMDNEIYNLTDYPLTLEAMEREGVLRFRLEYNTLLFKRETINRMLDDLLYILETISNHYNIEIQDIELPSHIKDAQKHEELEDIVFEF